MTECGIRRGSFPRLGNWAASFENSHLPGGLRDFIGGFGDLIQTSQKSSGDPFQRDKGFFPNYALTPVVRKQVLDANPKLAEYLNALSAKLDDATMARLNASVDVDKKTVEDVAKTFLKEQGLV